VTREKEEKREIETKKSMEKGAYMRTRK